MLEIMNLIFVRNKKDEILTRQDILKIVSLLTNLYGIYIDDVSFKKGEKRAVCYNTEDNKIVIDYEKCFRCNNASYDNYMMLFYLVHEIRHASQYLFSLTKSDIISRIYLDCFDYMSSGLLSKIFYSQNHDDFPIEINADIVAYLFIIYVAYMLGDIKLYLKFKDMLDRRIKMFTNSSYDVLKSVSGEDVLDYLSDVSEYDLFINGLIRDERKGILMASLVRM